MVGAARRRVRPPDENEAQTQQDMQNRTSTIFWPRAEPAADRRSTTATVRTNARAQRLRTLSQGLFYVALFWLVLFLEVHVRTLAKSESLEIWMLARRKAHLESELTRLDMRLTILESPKRLEALASSEMGLTVVASQEQPQSKNPQAPSHR